MSLRLALPLAAALLAAPLAARDDPAHHAEGRVSPGAVRAHIEFLADDLLKGRDTGSEGHEIAARYVASRYRAFGLQPASRDTGWFQRVRLQELTIDRAASGVTIGGRRFGEGEGAIIGIGAAETDVRLTAPAVFVGYGLDAPAQGFDDYAGLDVRGKIVVYLSGVPAGTPSDVAANLNSQKGQIASGRGAIGIVSLNTDADERTRSFQQSVRFSGRAATTWVGEDGAPFTRTPGIRASAFIDRPAATALFAGTRTPLPRLLREAGRRRTRPRAFDLARPVTIEARAARRIIDSPNVIGVLPGSDPAVADEYVLLMAHLDHIGVSEDAEGADKINNGAMDNAAGVATMLEAAHGLAEGERTRRPILFAAVTAEERGLLGADYLARHLPVEGRVVAVVNLDMPILLYDFRDVIAFGAEHSTMGPLVTAATESMGVRTSPDPLPQERLFTRSDHFRFVQQGVPAVFLMTGFAGEGRERFTNFLATNYHQPGDQPNLPFDWNAGARFAEVNLRIARAVANAPEAPRWYADSPFGRQYAPDAPKAERAAAD